MGNTGLKEFNKFVSFAYGETNVFVNINKENAGMIISFPLTNENGQKAFGINLFFDCINNKWRMSNSKNFDRRESDGKYVCLNGDWSEDIYSDKVYNRFTKLTLTVNEKDRFYELEDLKGISERRSFLFAKGPSMMSVPSPYIVKNKYNNVIDSIEINHETVLTKGDKKLIYNVYDFSSGDTKFVKYYENDVLEFTKEIIYSPDMKTYTIKLIDKNGIIGTTRIVNNDAFVELSSDDYNYRIKFVKQNNRIVQILEGYEESYKICTTNHIIEYYSGYSIYKTLDKYVNGKLKVKGNELRVFFDNDNRKNFEYDSRGNYRYYHYNLFNDLLATSKSFNINMNCLCDISTSSGKQPYNQIEINDQSSPLIVEKQYYELKSNDKIIYSKPVNGIGEDEYTLFALVKSECGTEIDITLETENETVSRSLSFCNGYQLVMLDLKESKLHSYIRVVISGIGNVEVGKIRIFNKCLLENYLYNDLSLVELVRIGNKLIEYNYNSIGGFESCKVGDGLLISDTSFDDYTIISDYGNIVQRNVYNHDFTKIVETKTEEVVSHDTLVKKYEYDDLGNCVKKVNENGNIEEYDYVDGKKVIGKDCYSIYTWAYENGKISKHNISQRGAAISSQLNYNYYNKNCLVHNSDLEYRFEYNKIDCISTITSGNDTLCAYLYNFDTGFLEKVTMPNYSIQYDYDEYGNISSITCNNDTILYEYDEYDRLIKEKCGDTILKQYDYSDSNKVTISDNKRNTNKIFNNVCINNDVEIEEVENIEYSFDKGFSIIDFSEGVDVERNRVTTINNKSLDGINWPISQKYYTKKIDQNDSIEWLRIDRGIVEYDFSSLKFGTIAFMMYNDDDYAYSSMNNYIISLYSFSTAHSGKNYCTDFFRMYLKSGKLCVQYYKHKSSTAISGDSFIDNFDKIEDMIICEILNDKKYYVSFSWRHISNFKYDLILTINNNEFLIDRRELYSNEFGKNIKLFVENDGFGNVYTPDSNDPIPTGGVTNSLYVANIMLSRNKIANKNDLINYSVAGGLPHFKRASNSEEFRHYTNDENFKIYPLHEFFESIDGERNYIFEKNSSSHLNDHENFVCELSSEKKCYISNGNLLAYNYNFTNGGTILLNVFVIDNPNSHETILEIGDSANTGFKIERYNKKISIHSGNSKILEIDNIEINRWNKIGVSFEKIVLPGTKIDDRRFVLNVNGTSKFTYSNIKVDFSGLTSIGRLYGYYGPISYAPFVGYIEKLCVKNSSCFERDMQINMENLLSEQARTYSSDEFGRVQKVASKKYDCIMMQNAYTYARNKKYSTYSSTLISKEEISFGTNKIIREYTYDNVGRVKTISENGILLHTYDYDYIGQLVKDTMPNRYERYDYNGNGNIKYIYKQNGFSYALTYHTVYKDKLIRINNGAIAYQEMNPISYKHNNCSWKGNNLVWYGDYSLEYDYKNRLIQINNDYSDGDESYCEVCKRIYYRGSKISKVVCNETTTIEYLYDSKDMVYGLVYAGNTYYFIRDILQTILGIVDSNGNVVVRYDYNAFGLPLDISGSMGTSLGKLNCIRYKGYYYVEETSLYYITSRYYDPEIGRFISPDSVDYLDPTTINGLNLYAYCGNDPVNRVDPTGHFFISTAVLIGAIVGGIIGAGVGFGIATYIDYKDDGEVFNGSVEWYDYVGATLLGGAVGAAIGAAVGYGIGYAAGGTYSNGLVAKSVNSGVKSFLSQANRVNHVLGKAGHNLEGYTVKTMGSLMKKTLAKGTYAVYKSVDSMIWTAAGSQVTYVIIDGIIKISDMWIIGG